MPVELQAVAAPQWRSSRRRGPLYRRPLSLLRVDRVEKVENAAKAKFSQKLADCRFLVKMRSSCEEEGRRKVLFKLMWSTVPDGVKRISGL
jgi:hypothetical protein